MTGLEPVIHREAAPWMAGPSSIKRGPGHDKLSCGKSVQHFYGARNVTVPPFLSTCGEIMARIRRRHGRYG
jgi:hypothetical protein